MMAQLGFQYYDEVPVTPEPTIQELLASLTGEEKGDILNGFTFKILPERLTEWVRERYGRTFTPKKRVVRRIYQAIDNIEEQARLYMRGEILITPAEIDTETGEVITPAVYNTPPTTANQLLTTIQDIFSDIFTSNEVQAVLNRMVEYSKHDGTGTWTYYKTEVVK